MIIPELEHLDPVGIVGQNSLKVFGGNEAPPIIIGPIFENESDIFTRPDIPGGIAETASTSGLGAFVAIGSPGFTQTATATSGFIPDRGFSGTATSGGSLIVRIP